MSNEAELFDNDDWHPDDREQAAELYLLDRQLDDEQAALQRLHDEDTLGFIAFADRPGWVEKRLSRKDPK